MAEFVTTVAAAAVLCTILELLVPKSGLKNTVRFAIGLLFMALMLTAVETLLRQGEAFTLSWKQTPPQEWAEQSQEQMIADLYEKEWERVLSEEEHSGE
ncbi:MAG: stage III sporulation protein AF [Eubacteriales bacterium]|nr:stage III sporulation protein AF [Eubacteriales bacterium]